MNTSYTKIMTALAIIFLSGSLYATEIPKRHIVAAPPKTDVGKIAPRKDAPDINAERRALRNQELTQVTEDANIVANLLLSELASIKTGDPKTALTGYGSIFLKYPKPEIAERTMQLALESPDTLNIARVIYERWQELSPVPTVEQKNLGWQLSALEGKTKQALEGLPEILAQSTELTRPEIFLLTAQLAVDNTPEARKHASKVHQLAMRYPDLPAAIIADIMYATIAQKNQDAVAGLQRLTKNKNNPHPTILLTLTILQTNAPHILTQFFTETPFDTLPDFLQSFQIDMLLNSGKSDQAYHIILKQIKKSPTSELYTQAGYLASLRDESPKQIQEFFNQAYALSANNKEQSRVALFAAIGLLKSKNTQEISQWVNKIHQGDYNFDRLILKAMLASENKQWRQMNQQIKQLTQLNEEKGIFFNQNHLIGLRSDYITLALKPQKALKEINQLLQEAKAKGDNQNVINQLHYARALLLTDRLNRHEEAVKDLEYYLSMNPHEAKAQNALGYTLLSIKGRLDEAMQLLQKAYSTEPESPAINDSIGWAYYLKGEAETALPYLEYAYEKMDESEIGAHLGEVLWALNRKDEARLIWQKSWQKNASNPTLKLILRKYHVQFTTPKKH